MNVKTLFGNNLQQYRKNAKLSQEKLAELVDVSPKHMSMLETGRAFVSADLLERISQVLGVSYAALFYSPKEKSLDASDLSNIDLIVAEELEKAKCAIGSRVHDAKGKVG